MRTGFGVWCVPGLPGGVLFRLGYPVRGVFGLGVCGSVRRVGVG